MSIHDDYLDQERKRADVAREKTTSGTPEIQKGKCRGCGAEIFWIKTTAGKAMPCDTTRQIIVTKGGSVVAGFLPHWGSCVAREMFKKKKTEAE